MSFKSNTSSKVKHHFAVGDEVIVVDTFDSRKNDESYYYPIGKTFIIGMIENDKSEGIVIDRLS